MFEVWKTKKKKRFYPFKALHFCGIINNFFPNIFLLGFQAEAAAPAGFNFGGNNATSTAPGVFAFGAANNNAAQSTAAAPQSTGGFNFGGQQQQQQPSGFGAQNTTGAAGSTPGVFAFG